MTIPLIAASAFPEKQQLETSEASRYLGDRSVKDSFGRSAEQSSRKAGDGVRAQAVHRQREHSDDACSIDSSRRSDNKTYAVRRQRLKTRKIIEQCLLLRCVYQVQILWKIVNDADPSRIYRLPFIHSSVELLLPSEPTAGVKERSAQSIERNAVRMLAVPAAPPGKSSGAPSAKPFWPFPSSMSSEKEEVCGNPDGVAKCSFVAGFCEGA